ncbi:FAS-associated death domain protein-like [Amphiura filiformis]|uniref:FAS-associated death domain protein-like n=1 Tax=Amphiura filiformis TaxID=82378 RepID=UPI003B21A2B0
MDRTRQYNAALMDIKANIDQMGPYILEDIKFCCGNIDGFSASELESIKSVTHLYKKLQQLDMLSIDNTKDLKDILSTCNLNACVKRLERYENGGAQSVQPVQQPHSQGYGDGHSSVTIPPNIRQADGPIIQAEQDDLSEAFDIIVENIGRDWRRLARRLPGRKITETEIEVLTDRHSRDLREQSRGVLLMWKEKNPDQAKKETLVKVLRQCEMNYIADRVEGWQIR